MIHARCVFVLLTALAVGAALPALAAEAPEVEDLDLLDGTPVLDIKPYVGEFDEHTEVRTGWLELARKRTNVADNRFKP